MALSESQIDALCLLLEDDRPAVAAVLDRQIAALSDADQERLLERLRKEGGRRGHPKRPPLPPALEAFHRRRLERAFSDWAVSPPGELDLEEAVFLLASFGYPLEDMRRRATELDEMAEALGARLRGAEEPEEVLRRTVDYLHGELGFEGDRENYYAPENSYLNRVLDRRRGIPISLSALYLLLGRRLGLPFRGVGMPGHFIVKYDAPGGAVFFDPFDGGRCLTVRECAAIVRELGYHFDVRFLQETPPRRIVERMLNNLIGIFQRDGDEERARRLGRYREIVHRG